MSNTVSHGPGVCVLTEYGVPPPRFPAPPPSPSPTDAGTISTTHGTYIRW